jgi:DNA-directed RNA polymerase subunit RPC12/RpoP
MSDHFINLTCANCGGQLEVYDDMERFACGYCGSEMLVQRRGGTVALKAITEAIKQVQVGTDKTAAELAIVRLNKDLEKLMADYARLEAQRSSSSGRAGCAISLFILLAISMIAMVPEKPGIGIGGLVLLIGLTVLIAKQVVKDKKRSFQMLVGVKSKIDQTKQEIDQNRRIVQG